MEERRPPADPPTQAKRMKFADELRRNALLQRQQLADTILNEMYQFVAFLDPSGLLLAVNAPALIAGGVAIEEVYLKPFWECYWWSTSEELPKRVKATVLNVAAGNAENYEAEVWGAKNGTAPITIDFTLKPIYGTTKQLVGMIAEARDITAKKAAEKELVRKNEELQHLYKRLRDLEIMRSQFFANVSHELRTPLALILGPTETFLRDSTFPQQFKPSIQVLRQNALLLLKHVNDILDLSKLDASKMALHYSDCDFWWLVSFVCSNFKLMADERQIAFNVEGDEKSEWRVVVDEEKITRVLLNLLSNAFKFTPPGGRITVSTSRSEDTIELKVSDTGPGVPEAQREAIFERFRQGDPQEGRQQHGGTGLGLSIVKEFVQLHGGAVHLGEAPGGGACFSFTVPVAPRQPVTKVISTGLATQATELAVSAMRSELGSKQTSDIDTPMEEVATAVHEPTNKARVLIVEDNADMRRFLRSTLSPHFVIYAASDGAQGLAEAQRLLPDVIVTDVMMPIMNGDVMMTKLREIPQLEDMPVLLLTAKADDQLRLRMLEEGVADFMSKPFSVAELIARVQNLAQTSRVRRLLQRSLDIRETNLIRLTQELAQRNSALHAALTEIKQARDEADRLNRMKDEFLMVVSHELRTPLHGILGWADIFGLDLKETGTISADDMKKGTQVILECSQVLLRMINDILELSRVASGRISLQCAPVDIHEVLSKALDAVQLAVQAKQLSLRVEFSGHIRVNGDAVRIQQVFCNLLSNAVKFTPANGSIYVTLAEDQTHVRVYVRDTGIGIEEKDFPRLFKHFSQLDSSNSRQYGGLGIGLALSRHLVELHGGNISVESEGKGKGSTFIVRLPRLESSTPAPSTDARSKAGVPMDWRFDWLKPETSALKKSSA